MGGGGVAVIAGVVGMSWLWDIVGVVWSSVVAGIVEEDDSTNVDDWKEDREKIQLIAANEANKIILTNKSIPSIYIFWFIEHTSNVKICLEKEVSQPLH